MEAKACRLLFFLISVVLLSNEFCTISESGQAPAMFIFGDSLIDNGNNNYLPAIARANYPPFGIDAGGPTGRFCNGLTVMDYAASYLGLQSAPPYLSEASKSDLILNGANYASAAAGILDETGKNYGVRVPFNKQIELFEKTLSTNLPLLIPNQEALATFIADSLFLFNLGSNDYLNNYLMPRMYTSSSLYSSEEYAKLLIDNLSQKLERLYELGARKFVVAGVGPLGCIPSLLALNKSTTGKCIDYINDLIMTFNSKVVQLTQQLNSTLPGSYFVYEDIYTVVADMINDPPKYGLTVINQACCGNGRYGGEFTCLPLETPCTERDQYLFWDSFHPTQAVNAIVAARCYSEGATDCYPISGFKLAQL